MKRLVYFLLLFPLLIWSQSNFDKAEKLFKEEKYNEALPIFESFLKTNPSDLRTIEYLGDIAGWSKAWDKAIVYYKRLKLMKPLDADFHYKYGGALGMKAKEVNKFKALGMIVGGSESKAIRYSNELLKISPIDGYLSRGHIEEYFKRYKTSEQQYRKAIAVSGSKTSYQKLANLYKNKMNEPEKAKAVLEEYRKKELSVSR